MLNKKIGKKITFLSIILVIISFLIAYLYIHKNQKIILENENKNELISIMFQNENGGYDEVKDKSFPTKGYTFNEKKSGCENGGTLSWNAKQQKVEASLLTSDKCYAYFDLDNNIYMSDKVLAKAEEKKGDATCSSVYDTLFYYEPDNEYYLSGPNDCIDFNYVWYSGKLWRITQINGDGTMKMITENNMTGLYFGATDNFETSWVYSWLNEDFLDTLYNVDKFLVKDARWELSSAYGTSIKQDIYKVVTATVGLLNPFEYVESGITMKSPDTLKYLVNEYNAWSSSRHPSDDNSIFMFRYDGIMGADSSNNIAIGVRPAVVLKSDVSFEGEGTKTNPFTIVGDKETGKTNEKINTRLSGEYVEVLGKKYRIVNIEKDSEGNDITKLVSLDYAKDENEGIVNKYSTNPDANIHNYNDAATSGNNDYWGAYLNNIWLSEDLKKYLTTNTYYVNALSPASNTLERNYKNTICKELGSTEPIKTCAKTENVFVGYVGLLRYGEMFAYPYDNDRANAQFMYYLSSSDEGGNWPLMYVNDGVLLTSYGHTSAMAAKPVITLKSDVYITSGDGKTPATAYVVAVP